MNMHGVILPVGTMEPIKRRGVLHRLADRVRASRWLLLFVVLPTLVVAGYYLLIASDQYQSEAHVLVRSAEQTPAAGAGLGAVVSLAGGLTSAQSEAMSVADYLASLDAVVALQRQINLVSRFQRPGVDAISRLGEDDTNPQDLLDYYHDMVSVAHHSDTGITTLSARAFNPKDAELITTRLLALAEARVNSLNQRGYRDAVASTERQLAEAEDQLTESQGKLTAFRANRRDIDPAGTGEAQIGLVSQLTERLSRARAQLAAMRGLVRSDAPQVVAQAAHVRALEAQVNAQSGRLTSGGNSISAGLGDYEELRLRQELAGKRYEAAQIGAQAAREQARRQGLYIVRVVEPNRPVKAEYPKRWRIIAAVFFGLLVAYSIGWLLMAGVREHQM